MKKYKVSDFKNSMPEWKRKKDPLIGRFFYRPLSRPISCFLANCGVNANTVSFFSIFIGLLGCFFYILDNHISHILGAIIFIVWAIFDCIDGDIARTVKKQPFGEFADATSCYILLAFMNIAMAVAVYQDGGFAFGHGSVVILVLGGITSSLDPLKRLIYHRFKDEEKKYVNCDNKQNGNTSKIIFIRDYILETISIGALQPFIILFFTLVKYLDVIIILNLFINIIVFVYVLLSSIRKTLVVSSNNFSNSSDMEYKMDN